jgi:hypothetical protein
MEKEEEEAEEEEGEEEEEAEVDSMEEDAWRATLESASVLRLLTLRPRLCQTHPHCLSLMLLPHVLQQCGVACSHAVITRAVVARSPASLYTVAFRQNAHFPPHFARGGGERGGEREGVTSRLSHGDKSDVRHAAWPGERWEGELSLGTSRSWYDEN